jgi:hypothetical protein
VTAAAPDVAAFTVTATFVTDDYFDVLGVKALRGRSVVRGDAAQVAVLSHAAWTRSFAQDPGILGRTITLADVAFTIVGVAAPRFRGAAWEARDDMQVWVPLASHARVFPGVSRESALFSAVGRLQPGTTREDAGIVAKAVAARSLSVRNIYPDSAAEIASRDPSVEVVRLLADNLEPGAEADARFATIAFSVLGLLTLLVTCANVGALQTGLALARRREVAIRMSLGAHRGRVIRQLVTESVALAIIAALGAVGVTWGLVRLLLHIVGSFSFELVLDQTAVAFAFGIALPVGLLFGLSPALHATRNAVAGALRDSSRAIAGGRAGLQRGLVVAQIACGSRHTAVVTSQGALYSWGDKENGVAGHGEVEGHQYTPRLVERLAGKRIVQLSACGFHTGCLTDSLELYTWGGACVCLVGIMCCALAFMLT